VSAKRILENPQGSILSVSGVAFGRGYRESKCLRAWGSQ
jgi:hypothetical protein